MGDIHIFKYTYIYFFHSTDQAFVTLATNDNYAKGAMVLGKSLRNHNTSRKLVVLIGPHVAEPTRYDVSHMECNNVFDTYALL